MKYMEKSGPHNVTNVGEIIDIGISGELQGIEDEVDDPALSSRGATQASTCNPISISWFFCFNPLRQKV